MSDPLISLHNISMTFQGRTVLNAISMDVEHREIVTLIGPNGAGKTTLVRIVLGLQQASAGKRILTGELRIGYMPQKLQINRNMPLSVKRFLSMTGSKMANIESALDRTGVGKVIHSPVQSLSGGELQRVLLARALLKKPHLLVLDEPVQGVDANGQKELYRLITELRNENQCAVLMVSHDLHLVMASTDRVVCINQHVCCSGHPHTVKKHPAYLKLFGDEARELAIYTHQHDHSHDIHGHITLDQKEDR